MNIGFDLISDLNLSPTDSFDWDGKATSLYCVVAGNISTDIRVIGLTLANLARHYQGVFYVAGPLEFQGITDIPKRVNEISRLCKRIRNVAFLYHNVVIIDGVAILGANGWYGEITPSNVEETEIPRFEDMLYLRNSVEKLQRHLDVKKILMVTGAVPNEELYFGEIPEDVYGHPEMTLVLLSDSEKKVSHWAFGTHEKIVDTTFSNINYINNPPMKNSPYWAKRIEVTV